MHTTTTQPLKTGLSAEWTAARRQRRAEDEPDVKRTPLQKLFIYLGVIVLIAVFSGPFILVILNSLKSEVESSVLSFEPPKEWLFSNYATVFEGGNAGQALVNGFIVATSVALLTIMCSASAAFVIARRDNRFTRWSYKYLLVGMIAPFAFIPAIRLLQQLHLYDTHVGLILTDVAGQIPFTTLLFVGFIKAIPQEVDEAAIIDGCSPWRLFWQIIFPNLRPVVATNIVLLFTFGWNEFQNVLFLVPSSDKWTMPMTILQFRNAYSYNYALVCANLVVSLIPVVIVYLLMQRRIIGGMMVGSTKG